MLQAGVPPAGATRTPSRGCHILVNVQKMTYFFVLRYSEYYCTGHGPSVHDPMHTSVSMRRCIGPRLGPATAVLNTGQGDSSTSQHMLSLRHDIKNSCTALSGTSNCWKVSSGNKYTKKLAMQVLQYSEHGQLQIYCSSV